MGDGDTGVRGIGPGDRRERAGREVFVAAEMLRDSLGLAARAYIFGIALLEKK